MATKDINNNTVVSESIAQEELLNSLTSVFDQLLPYDKITVSDESEKQRLFESIKTQDKAMAKLVLIKDQMKDKLVKGGSNNDPFEANEDMSTQDGSIKMTETSLKSISLQSYKDNEMKLRCKTS